MEDDELTFMASPSMENLQGLVNNRADGMTEFGFSTGDKVAAAIRWSVHMTVEDDGEEYEFLAERPTLSEALTELARMFVGATSSGKLVWTPSEQYG
jgi:hypothetical protein